jgi:hypothetical protein
MPTRAAAVREVLKLGLASVGVDAKAGVKSSNYGLFGRWPEVHTPDSPNGNAED